jgi:hypothetical protein
MKSIVVLITIFLTQTCSKAPYGLMHKSDLPAEIQEMYFQNWVGGQERTGGGTNFVIQFKSELPADIKLKSVFFKGKSADFETKPNNLYVAYYTYKPKNDMILENDATKEYGNQAPDITQNDSVSAEIFFIKNEKTYSYKVETVKEKEMLAYPSAKPRN